MKEHCLWCGTTSYPEGDDRDGAVTRGICRECMRHFYLLNNPQSFRQYLDRLAPPVLMVDADVRIIAANAKACEILGKEPTEIEERYGGEAIECSYSRLPGGCGRAVHCRTCAIRNTVTDTYATSRSHERVPAYPDVKVRDAAMKVQFLISTEKAGDLVLLRIDDVGVIM